MLNKRVVFEQFLEESFSGGICLRELRLSHEELEYITKKYPHAKIRKIQDSNNSRKKCWYQIKI